MRDDAAYDLACLEAFSLGPGERAIVRTGVSVTLPAGMVGLVLPRSRLAFEHGVTVVNAPGLVEPGYGGELGVILVNLGTDVFVAEAGSLIAMLLLVPFS